MFYYTQYAKEWSDQRYNDVVRNGFMVPWNTLEWKDRVRNRIEKKLHYFKLWSGLFDLQLYKIRKVQKFKRWRKGDITYKNF